jgi:hypothetical protein
VCVVVERALLDSGDEDLRELSQNQRRRILDSLRLLFRKVTFDLKQTEMRWKRAPHLYGARHLILTFFSA